MKMAKSFAWILGVLFLAGCASTKCQPCSQPAAQPVAAAPVAAPVVAPVPAASVAAAEPAVEEAEPVVKRAPRTYLK